MLDKQVVYQMYHDIVFVYIEADLNIQKFMVTYID